MRRMLCLLLAGLALLTLSGCRSVFEREYYYETPYSGDIGMPSDQATEIRNYNMLKTALTNMITNHTEKGEFRFVSYNGSLNEDLAAACFEIKSDHPLGAYAVETLSYDTSYVVSYYMANIYITYKRTARELQSIVYTSTTEDFDESVFTSVDEYEPSLVIRCFSPGIDETYIRRLVQRHYYDDPTLLITQPQVEVTSYPADGTNCIYELRFRYGVSRQRGTVMSAALTDRLKETAAAMTETGQPKLALESALYLSENCAEGSAYSIYADTAYGAVVQGDADSKGLALAYRALCAVLGIDCTVVEGGSGGINAQSHYWNIICLDGDYYHVDVSAMAADPAQAFLLNDETLWGRLIWETADYPACDGPLDYAAVAGIPEAEETEQTPETQRGAEEAPGPEETVPPEENEPPLAESPPERSGEAQEAEDHPGETLTEKTEVEEKTS